VARRYKFCVNCRRTITDAEVRRGLYVEGPRGMLCATCARRLDEAPETAEPAVPASATPSKPVVERPVTAHESRAAEKHLEGIREMVESIHRTLLFEKTSSWNVAGAVAQCLTVGMLLIAAVQWLEEGGAVFPALLVAIVFQLMALTFFVKAK